MNALKANLVISGVMGAIVAGIAAQFGSAVWWLWGACFTVMTFVAIAVAQVASLADEAAGE
jgi:hypothetical protein